MEIEHAVAVERENGFVVSLKKGAEGFCLHTSTPDGAAERFRQAAKQSLSLRTMLKNPRAAASAIAGISLKALWETLFCPVHGVIGKLAAGALIVGLGLVTYESWERVAGVLEWALPAALLARAGWQVVKVKRAAKAVLDTPAEKIEVVHVERHAHGNKCAHPHGNGGFFGWKTAFKARKQVTLYKPKPERQAVLERRK